MPTLTQKPKKNAAAGKMKSVSSPDAAQRSVLNLRFEPDIPPNDTDRSFPYSLFIPLHYEPNYAYPLLIWLHPCGENERQLMKIMPQVSLRNYVAAAPQGILLDKPVRQSAGERTVSAMLHRQKPHYGWSDAAAAVDETEQKVFDSITLAKERCNIAERRTFLAGSGSGGTAALRLAMMYPERFAGAASFGGAVPQDIRLSKLWQTSQPLNVLLGIGLELDAAGQSIEILHTAGAALEIAEFPNVNTLTAEMLQSLNRWMMNIVVNGTAENTKPVKLPEYL
ncbi:MAG: hypothetical protein LBT89_03240 [Planctomycetaceae bacterium]|jgi:phospholipase/carboxylesterase|nr:hypothetical protein [Planctomycetaceae bacterium]